MGDFDEYIAYVFGSNAVELAIVVVVAFSFMNTVAALVRDFFSPIVASWLGLANLYPPTRTNTLVVSDFGPSALGFLAIVVLAALYMALRLHWVASQEMRDCPECLSEIPMGASRCAYCTATVPETEPPRRRGRRRRVRLRKNLR